MRARCRWTRRWGTEMDYRDMGRDAVLHGDKEALRVAIIPGVSFLSSPLLSLCLLLLAFPTSKDIHTNKCFHNA
jgi:hypothetical protein